MKVLVVGTLAKQSARVRNKTKHHVEFMESESIFKKDTCNLNNRYDAVINLVRFSKHSLHERLKHHKRYIMAQGGVSNLVEILESL